VNLSEFSIKHPVFAWMLMSALIIFGGISMSRMGVSQMPDVDFPVLTVGVDLAGAAPAVMETEVADVVEDAIMTVQGIRSIKSVSRQGSTSVTIEFDLNRDIDIALQDVQAKLQQALHHLPEDIEPPSIRKTNPEDQPILWLTVRSDRFSRQDLMAYTRDHIKDKLSTCPGVGEISLGGYLDPNLRVWLSNARLRNNQLTVNDVVSSIQNEHAEYPGGIIETPDKEYNVRMLGEAQTPAQFANIRINSRGGSPNYRPIRLGDVARIEDGTEDVRRITRTNGKTSVSLGILKQRGSNAVEVAKAVKQRIAQIQKQLPEGMAFGTAFDATTYIENNVNELKLTLLLAGLLTGLVCWMFLGGWSSTLNVLLAIPTSIVGSFIVLYFSGFTLNTFTLLGLSLAIGIVVDDAIMMLENIIRHQEKGEEREAAALKGSYEIQFAAVAVSISVVAIFLPVAFMSGVIGRYFFQYGVTITVAVLLSLVEALTLTPMRCAAFVEAGERTTAFGRLVDKTFQASRIWYRRTLEVSLANRWKVILVSTVFFAVSMILVSVMRKEFTPFQDMSVFFVRLQGPIGSSLALTDSRAKQAESILATRPELNMYMMNVGGGSDVSSASGIVSMKPMGKRGKDPVLKREIGSLECMDIVRKEMKKIPNVRVSIQDPSSRGFGSGRGYPVEFSVRGPDWDKLASYSQAIMAELQKTGFVTDLDSDYRTGMPEVDVIPDREKASARGVSVSAIGTTINALVGGVVAARYESKGRRADIRVKLELTDRDRTDAIKNLMLRNNRGEMISLAEVVRLENKTTLQQITRVDRERAVTVFANVTPGKSQSDALAAVHTVAAKILPLDYRVIITGSAQTFIESFRDLGFAMFLGVLVAYMILASQFNSYVDPLTVLMALPFSVSGALVSLWIAGQSINVYSFIGLILLLGIVKKNSILLVEFTNQVGDRKKVTAKEGLLEACPIRLRPILMTSIATVAAAIPAAINLGPGAETRAPMAIGIIGGVIVSTALTLYVVPCVYSLFSRFDKRWIREDHGSPPA
jgi:HAE1 family hydrophobic/amphiphilic exporter-1